MNVRVLKSRSWSSFYCFTANIRVWFVKNSRSFICFPISRKLQIIPLHQGSLLSEQSVLEQDARILRSGSMFIDQSRSVLPLQSAKAREFGKFFAGRNVRARLGPFCLNWLEPVLSAGQNGKIVSIVKVTSKLICR